MNRIEREKKVVELMVRLYCAHHHDASLSLCDDCRGLLDYAWNRLDRCPYGCQKPACSHCKIHCYRQDMRQKIVAVMRFSGPRMIWKHPWSSLRHLIDRFSNLNIC